jgi:hypothetical protein
LIKHLSHAITRQILANPNRLVNKLFGVGPSGMRWNIETAQYIISLMIKAKSNCWRTDVVLKIVDNFDIPFI